MRITVFFRNAGLVCLCMCLFLHSAAQTQRKEGYNWLFGARVGMTWNTTQTIGGLSGLPTPYYGSAMPDTWAGVFCMSDVAGNLLFYSNGMTIWNSNHTIMQNGSGLTGHINSTQSGIVIPYPERSNMYIVITIGLNTTNILTYSVIDMTLDGGLGGVVAGQKNIQLTGAMGILGECVAAVKHANEKDYWIVAVGKGIGTSSAMNVWKITSAGVQTACFASYALPATTDTNSSGYLRFSVDGTYFAWPATGYQFFFGEFSPATGTFPTLKVMNAGYHGYGVEFSLSCEILYAITNIALHSYKFRDLLTSAVPGSMPHFTQTVTLPNLTHEPHVGALQLGPDGRIYSPIFQATDMVVIDNVNDYGNSTVTIVSGLLPTTGYGRNGLPNFLAETFKPIEVSFYINNIHYQNLDGALLCDTLANFRAHLEYAQTSVHGFLRWYIDGIEQISKTDTLEWKTNLSQGNHTVAIDAVGKNNDTVTISANFNVGISYYDTVTATICLGERYNMNGFDLTPTAAESVQRSQFRTTALGCDSIITLNLTVNSSYNDTIKATIYLGEHYNQYGFDITPDETGIIYPPPRNLQTAYMCDSIINLILTVVPIEVIPETITAFSPFNKDGINDYFMAGSKIQVFNRYGALIYETKTEEQQQRGWDGRNNKGREVEPGMYFYILYNSNGKPVIKSSVEVLKR